MTRRNITARHTPPGRRVRGALAGAAVGGLMLGLVPASPAAAAGPTAIAYSICSATYPYSTQVRISGFPPNEAIPVLTVFYPQHEPTISVGGPIYTDATGAASFPALNYATPYKLGFLFFRDLDRSGTYSRGDDVIANLLLTIDKPCTGAVAQPK